MLSLDELVFNRVFNELKRAVGVRFFRDPVTVAFNGSDAQVQGIGYLRIGFFHADELQDIHFAFGEFGIGHHFADVEGRIF